MSESSAAAPHINEPNSPLETLALRALRRHGEMAPSTYDGDALLLFIDYANEVIDDIRSHPYWEGGSLSYYGSLTEVRQIPDHILIAGLMAKHSEQQNSESANRRLARYFAVLNQHLHYLKFGGSPELELQAVDIASSS